MQKTKTIWNILVVEDTPIAARMTRIALEKMGCTVDCVAHGEAALQKSNNTYHLILLDLGLPGMDGYETARQLRDQHQAPIIALTALGNNPETISLVKKSGMNGYVVKPLTPDVCDLLLKNMTHDTLQYFFIYPNPSEQDIDSSQ